MPAMSPLLTVMHKAAEKAVPALLRDFGELESLQVSEKSPNNFVTAADKRAEKTIFLSLAKDRPDWGFLMEEGGEKKSEANPDSNKRFIIDPIDGTHNFMRGVPEWCISIGAEEDGEITAALILDPIRQETFWAEKGKGAYLNHKRMRVSGRKSLEQATIAYWFVYNNEYCAEPMHKCRTVEDALRRRASTIRMIGSTCLELAWVAAGRMDGYIQGPLSPWDLAAGNLLVTEAGGVMTDWNGRKDNVVHQPFVIAGNADVHRELLSIAQK